MFSCLCFVTAALFISSVVGDGAPVACDGISFGVGNMSLSSGAGLQLLNTGPSHNAAGKAILQIDNDTSISPDSWHFLTCNSSFMGFENTLDRGPNNTVNFYGHIVRPGAVGQLFDRFCLERSPNGDLVQGICSHVDGPSQLPQYWHLVKSATTPLAPGPLNFLGAPNGTTLPFTFVPALHKFNGTQVVAEVATRSANPTQFELFFTLDE